MAKAKATGIDMPPPASPVAASSTEVKQRPTAVVWEPPAASLGDQELKIKFLVYGNYGMGKTVLAATSQDVPEMKRVLYVDAEAGTLSIRARKDLHTFRLTEFKHINDLVGYMRSPTLPDQYDTLIIDSMTEVAKMVIRRCIIEARDANPQHDRDIAEQRDWQRYTERMRVIVRAFRDAPVNVIMTALEREIKDETTGAISYGPMIQGQQIGVDLGAFVDIIGRITPIEGGRRLHLHPTGKFAAKDRSGLLPPQIDNPTMKDIYGRLSAINGGA